MVRMISQLPNTSGQVVQCRRMALIPFDQALVKADDNVFKTPFIPKKRKKVLEEEPYTKELERIIQRDFFPDVPKLKAQNEYLDAEARNDMIKLRELQMQYRPTPKRQNTSSSTVSASPLSFQSPATFETPASPLSRGTGDSVDRKPSGSENTNPPEGPKEELVEPINSHGLDTFLQRVTSEDNASFEDIMEESEAKHKRRYPWLYDDAWRAKAKGGQLAIKGSGSEALAIESGRSNTVDTWDYKAKNAVMQVPEGVAFTSNEIAEREKQKIVVQHKNTRFLHDPWKDMAVSADDARNLTAGKIGPDGLEITSSGTPKVNGYGFVAPPSPMPGVGESPMMTWGEIEGTPFALDASDTSVLSLTPGPQFKIPEVPDRDKIHLELVDNVTKRHRAKKDEALKQVRSLASTPKFGYVSPADRLATMSPAAQKLATTRLGIRLGTDKALVASYSPSPRRNPQTPSTTPGTGGSTPKTPLTPSITDDLLDLRNDFAMKK